MCIVAHANSLICLHDYNLLNKNPNSKELMHVGLPCSPLSHKY